ncbi:unnamed protein product [Arabis nemorensis]|uniref:Uncharacterized protein n=1 Tax=Arabis nemorensis TaxID=586526 RepID=A0A565BIS7_9BRAS|nr:unnamed protein product [Arabis nemorensis]
MVVGSGHCWGITVLVKGEISVGSWCRFYVRRAIDLAISSGFGGMTGVSLSSDVASLLMNAPPLSVL